MKKQLSRRDFLRLTALGAAGAALVACGQPAATPQPDPVSPDEETGPPAAAGPQIVTFTMYGHPGLVEPMVEIFNETHDDVQVDFERSEGQGYWEKLTASVAAGQAWDCFRGDQVRSLGWGPRGVIADIQPFLDADSVYPEDNYIDGTLAAYRVGGRLFGLPAWALTMWLFYNKNIFDEAGVAYPDENTTWDDMVTKALATTQRDGDRITQYGTNAWEWWTFPVAQAVWTNGGRFYYTEDMQATAVDDPETIKAMQDIADLIHVHRTNPSPLNPPTSPVGLLSDNVAMEANGDYMPADNREVFMEKYEYLDATLCPSRNGQRSNIYWPDALLINARSNVQDAAYKWLAWFSGNPDSIALQGQVVFPVVKNAYSDPAIASRWLVPPRPQGMIDLALKHSQDAQLWRADLRISDLDSVYYNEVGRIWNNEDSAEVVMNEMQQEMMEIMSRPPEVEL
jgi:multiple sugar transport system substrate-binding protein